MNFFYLNDCIPKKATSHVLVACLQNTLSEYNDVKLKYPNEVDGVITEKEPHTTILNDEGYTLAQCINDLDSKSKRLAYSVLNKYPIENIFPIEDDLALLEKDYSLTIGEEKHSAINLALTNQNDGILFTLSVHDDLKKNHLNLIGNTDSIEVSNLFGEKNNTEFINGEIESTIQSKLGNFEKLLAIIGDNAHSDRFKKGFDHATKNVQESIIEHFTIAKDRKGATNFFSDEYLIKDVTPSGEVKVKVYELRIFDPVAYRVYFHETEKKVYLAIVEKKPPKKVQSSHISSSKDIINELIIKEGKLQKSV
jgi:hypothetical protein